MDFTFYKCTNDTHFLPTILDKVNGLYVTQCQWILHFTNVHMSLSPALRVKGVVGHLMSMLNYAQVLHFTFYMIPPNNV